MPATKSLLIRDGLLGFRYAYQACTDPTIRRLLERYLSQEGSQTLPDLPGVDLGGQRNDR
jgi:mannitol 2-dehydrogenase